MLFWTAQKFLLHHPQLRVTGESRGYGCAAREPRSAADFQAGVSSWLFLPRLAEFGSAERVKDEKPPCTGFLNVKLPPQLIAKAFLFLFSGIQVHVLLLVFS